MSNARRIGILALLTTLGGSGWYVFVYLYRWEWNRALISGVIFVAAEVALLGTLLLERVGRIERRIVESERQRSPGPDPVVLTRVRDAAPASQPPFAWLTKDPNRTSVFVPVLLGAGVVLSGLAWLVERVARISARPAAERSLALRLEALSPPADGLLASGAYEQQPDLFSPLR